MTCITHTNACECRETHFSKMEEDCVLYRDFLTHIADGHLFVGFKLATREAAKELLRSTNSDFELFSRIAKLEAVAEAAKGVREFHADSENKDMPRGYYCIHGGLNRALDELAALGKGNG